VRRVLLVNALIFAILAAAVALAYYGYSYTTEVVSRDRELQLMQDLAEEKVSDIEALVTKDDDALFQQVRLDDLAKLRELAAGVSVESVFVLDDQFRVIPDGYVGSRPLKEGIAFRDWFLARVVPELVKAGLPRQPPGERGHLFREWDGTPYLFSFTRKNAGERTFYIVVEDSLSHLVVWLFPQFFRFDDQSKRLYQVVDERGGLRYGAPFVSTDPDDLPVRIHFRETVDSWVLRVEERDNGEIEALNHRRLIDSLLIGSAVTVVLAGLAFLAIAIRRERRANDLKSEFISNVSHELKTPLSIISMFGELLANGRTKSVEQAHEYAEIIWRESVRLGRLIDNVLDFAKIERGLGVYEFADTDVGEVVHRAVELVERRTAGAGMTAEVEVEPDLPVVHLDSNAFTLAVLNLVDNAIKYAADGKRIEVKLRRDGDRVVLTVHDFGPGIDPEEHERIFDRFYRARAMRLKPIRGSGIGLALVRHIARAHGGDIGVTSTPGQGSTFTLWLPIAPRPATA
jgi:two-component system, OmpR family, phosphate regulon sensor histidine kinase PhoR